MNRIVSSCIMILVCVTAAESLAKPFDSDAVEHAKRLSELIRRPLKARHVPAQEAVRLLALVRESHSLDVQLCAILSLAWSDDEESLGVVREIAQRHSAPGLPPDRLGGAAAYAVVMREPRQRDSKSLFSILCFHLGRTSNAWERVFIANRLWVDFGADAEWVILEAAKHTPANEHTLLPRIDFLYYLAQTNNPVLAREALRHDWPRVVIVGGQVAYLMHSITPGRAKQNLESMAALKALRKTAAKATQTDPR